MTTPSKPAAAPQAAASKSSSTKIDHTDCYAAKLHPATPAGRSLCRSIRAEGKPLTKKSFTAAAAKKAEPKKAAPKTTPASPEAKPDPTSDDPYDEADASA